LQLIFLIFLMTHQLTLCAYNLDDLYLNSRWNAFLKYQSHDMRHIPQHLKCHFLRNETLRLIFYWGGIARAHDAGLTRRQLSVATGIPIHWLGRWERDRSFPTEAQWQTLSGILCLDSKA
jgi:hypothetical protein